MSNEVDLIKDRLDIAEVVGEYVALKRYGQHFKGLCPFHQEKTPSFVVSPDKGIWHCFGCGEGGDVFSFVEKIEGIEFRDTLKLLAERAGVELTRRAVPGAQAPSKRQRLFELLDLASRFYHEILVQLPAGEQARAYLKKRGVTVATIQEFHLGYAPAAWDSLQNWLRHKQFHPKEMIEAGLVGESSQGKLYDRFRGRIMFPIQDLQGRTVAFGGRIAPWHETGEEGKYINSPETELYEKRRVVYNLSRAKSTLRKGEPCIVVEGYFDVALLSQAGIPGVVATSGTAFTAEQVIQIERYTKRIYFAFDADRAGMKATVAATEAALSAGLEVASIVLPSGQDPADVAAADPMKAQAIFSQPQSLIQIWTKRLAAKGESLSQAESLQALLPLIQGVANPIQQGRMIQETAAILHVPEGRVIELLSRLRSSSSRPAGNSGLPERMKDEPLRQLEQWTEHEFLGLFIESKEARSLWTSVEKSFFLDSSAQRLYTSVAQIAGEDSVFASASGDALIAKLPAELQSLAEAARVLAQEAMAKTSDSPEIEARTLLRRLQRRSLSQRLRTMQQTLAQAGEKERAAALEQFQKTVEELAQLP